MRLATQVPYYDDIVNATSRLDHETAAYKVFLMLKRGRCRRHDMCLTSSTLALTFSEPAVRRAGRPLKRLHAPDWLH